MYSDIKEICRIYNILYYTINEDNSINVDDNIHIYRRNLKNFPLKFGDIIGSFDCSYNELVSLNGSPENVGFNYYCEKNNLISLEGCTKNIGSNLDCSYNELVSLKGGPLSVGRNFVCRNNQIRSLEGFPENLKGYFLCDGNPIHSLVDSWINNTNRHSMVEYFNDLDIIRDGGEVIIMDRLEEFIDIYKVKIDLKEVEKYYALV